MSRTQRRIPQGSARGLHGFSIVELLIALIIIGVLTAVLVPSVSHRTQESRLLAAKTDMEVIAAAEDRVASDIGFYVRLFALDDLALGDGVAETYPVDRAINPRDGIVDERLNSRVTANSNSVFIRMATRTGIAVDVGPSIVSATDALTIYTGILGANINVSAADPNYAPNWRGPYFTIRNQPKTNDLPADGLHLSGIPSDPWGNNYLLFFRNGFVREPDGTIATSLVTADDAINLFDRPTLVSFGPDGRPGNNGVGAIGTGDDIVYGFGY